MGDKKPSQKVRSSEPKEVVSETGKAKMRRHGVERPSNFNDQVPSEEGTEGTTEVPVSRGEDCQGGTDTNEGETPDIGDVRNAPGDVQS